MEAIEHIEVLTGIRRSLTAVHRPDVLVGSAKKTGLTVLTPSPSQADPEAADIPSVSLSTRSRGRESRHAARLFVDAADFAIDAL